MIDVPRAIKEKRSAHVHADRCWRRAISQNFLITPNTTRGAHNKTKSHLLPSTNFRDSLSSYLFTGDTNTTTTQKDQITSSQRGKSLSVSSSTLSQKQETPRGVGRGEMRGVTFEGRAAARPSSTERNTDTDTGSVSVAPRRRRRRRRCRPTSVPRVVCF